MARLAGGGGSLDGAAAPSLLEGAAAHAASPHREPTVGGELCEELLETERLRLVRVEGWGEG